MELSGVTVNNGDTITAAQIANLVYTRWETPTALRWPPSTSRSTTPAWVVVAAQMDIDITPVNDVPTATVNTVSTTEDNGLHLRRRGLYLHRCGK